MPTIPPRTMQLLDDETDRRAALLKDLYTAYEEGDLDPGVWEIAAAEVLKQGSLHSAALGAGSWGELDEDALAEIEDGLDEQFDYLDDFLDEMDGEEPPTPGEVGSRLGMYAGVTRAFFFAAFLGKAVQGLAQDQIVLVRRLCEDDAASCQDCRALAELGWRLPGTLPYPGRMARCGGNCRCGWEAQAFNRADVDEEALSEPIRLGHAGSTLYRPKPRPEDEIEVVGFGGPSSGNWGHAGVPGERGGSAAGGGHGRIGAAGTRAERMQAIQAHREAKAEGAAKSATLKAAVVAATLARHPYGGADYRGALRDMCRSCTTTAQLRTVLDAHQVRFDKETQGKNERVTELVGTLFAELNGPETLTEKELGSLLGERDQLIEDVKGLNEAASEIMRDALLLEFQFRANYSVTDDRVPDSSTAYIQANAFCGYLSVGVGDGTFEVVYKDAESGDAHRAYALGQEVHITPGSRYDSPEGYFHELAHVVENRDAGVQKACAAFLEARTQGEKPVALTSFARYAKSDNMQGEMCKPDKFLDPYVGKIYADGATEVLSMGMELFRGNAQYFYRADPEHFMFTLSTMRGLKEK